MFNLIAQYIGYGAELEVADANQPTDRSDCSFGETQEGEWTLVEVVRPRDKEALQEEEFHRVASPSPVASLQSSVTEDAEVPMPVPVSNMSTVAQVAGRRMRCAKNNKKKHIQQCNLTPLHPNQMKRSNQALCNRGAKVYQKMRQIVHQPRKF